MEIRICKRCHGIVHLNKSHLRTRHYRRNLYFCDSYCAGEYAERRAGWQGIKNVKMIQGYREEFLRQLEKINIEGGEIDEKNKSRQVFDLRCAAPRWRLFGANAEIV